MPFVCLSISFSFAPSASTLTYSKATFRFA
jgi:hypothetical protein